MRKLILIQLLALAACCVYANPVSQEEAKKNAISFLQKRSAKRLLSNRSLTAGKDLTLVEWNAEASLAKGVSAISDAPFYIYNVGEGDGFIIVSGSDRTSKILGYSDSGSINAADIPSNMRSFLQSYEEQIEAIEQADAKLFAVDDDASADSTESDTLASIEPLLKSNWNQNYPFCAKCPVIKGEQTVTGCGPTAVAQILNYYKYPSSTLALIPGYTYDTLDSLEIDSIAAGMAINWDAISDTYPYCASTTAKDLGLSEEQTDAISSLMMICCTALQASFSANGTGSNFYAIKNTLKNYFGYDDGTSTVDKDLYGEKEWIALLHKELAENRPVIYEGSDKNGNGGHIFILDGYESGETFHINWGWGGYADGYFLLSLCNPLKYEFSIDNAAVIGIMPNDGMKFKEDSIRLTTKRLVANYLENGYNFGSTKSDSIFTRNSPNQNFSMIILFKFKNDMRLTYDFDYGLAINTNDSVAFSSSINVAEGWNSSVLFTFYFGAGLEDGVYTIYPISKESGTDEWLKCRDADKYSLNVMLKGDTLRIYPDRESAEEAFATGISHITYDNNPAASRIFDLSGRQLSTRPEKGLYIRGNKKILKSIVSTKNKMKAL